MKRPAQWSANVRARIKALWDRQHVHPRGIMGHVVAERMARQHAIETHWTLRLLGIGPADRVLEIGFGAGKGLALAAQATRGFILGIDVSRTMAAHARRRNRAAWRQGRMALLQADVADLPFGEERFDRVFSIHTYYFWRDPARITAQILRSLRPGGSVVVTVATGIVGASGDVDYSTFGNLHDDIAMMLSTMKEQGYADARLERGPNNRHFNNVALVGVKGAC